MRLTPDEAQRWVAGLDSVLDSLPVQMAVLLFLTLLRHRHARFAEADSWEYRTGAELVVFAEAAESIRVVIADFLPEPYRSHLGPVRHVVFLLYNLTQALDAQVEDPADERFRLALRAARPAVALPAMVRLMRAVLPMIWVHDFLLQGTYAIAELKRRSEDPRLRIGMNVAFLRHFDTLQFRLGPSLPSPEAALAVVIRAVLPATRHRLTQLDPNLRPSDDLGGRVMEALAKSVVSADPLDLLVAAADGKLGMIKVAVVRDLQDELRKKRTRQAINVELDERILDKASFDQASDHLSPLSSLLAAEDPLPRTPEWRFLLNRLPDADTDVRHEVLAPKLGVSPRTLRRMLARGRRRAGLSA